jgi:hypothetical protein
VEQPIQKTIAKNEPTFIRAERQFLPFLGHASFKTALESYGEGSFGLYQHNDQKKMPTLFDLVCIGKETYGVLTQEFYGTTPRENEYYVLQVLKYIPQRGEFNLLPQHFLTINDSSGVTLEVGGKTRTSNAYAARSLHVLLSDALRDKEKVKTQEDVLQTFSTINLIKSAIF